MFKGSMSFEELDKRLAKLLKRCEAYRRALKSECDPDPVVLDPDHFAVAHRRVTGHHQAEA